jgi:hypothetical protein
MFAGSCTSRDPGAYMSWLFLSLFTSEPVPVRAQLAGSRGDCECLRLRQRRQAHSSRDCAHPISQAAQICQALMEMQVGFRVPGSRRDVDRVISLRQFRLLVGRSQLFGSDTMTQPHWYRPIANHHSHRYLEIRRKLCLWMPEGPAMSIGR